MKEHFCPVEKSMIAFEKECNWCGEKELAFNEIERQAGQRKEAVRAAVATNPYRDLVIEEVAQHVEKLTGYGFVNIDGLAVYIREMKK